MGTSRIKKRLSALVFKAINHLPIHRDVAARLKDVGRLEAKARSIATRLEALAAAEAKIAETAVRLAELSRLEEKVRDLDTLSVQLQDSIKQMGGLIPPPPPLQARVSGVYHPHFVRHGESLVHQLRRSLANVGQDLGAFDSILDFGCGCGRVLSALHFQRGSSQRIYGTDIDTEAISWCRENYSKAAEFSVNGAMPPLEFAAHSFDLIYSVSIFTHLPEAMQFAWLGELRRVSRRGGYLLLTTHGNKHIELFPAELRRETFEKGFCYLHAGNTDGLPDFYQVAYHTPDYVRRRWSDFFEIIQVQERALDDSQDIVVCRVRD